MNISERVGITGVRNAKIRYGDYDIAKYSSKIIFTYGETDPWLPTYVLHSSNPEVVVLRADDSYHCQDFPIALEDAEGSMLELLTKAEKTLEKWLKEAKKAEKKKDNICFFKFLCFEV